MKTDDRLRVPPEQLRWSLDPAELGFASTAEVAPGTRTPGQSRAVRAMEVGLALRGHGYNIFVAGDPNTIRTTTVGRILDQYDDSASYTPEDLCFVYNFRDPDKPCLLRFPAGQGRAFRDDLEQAVQRLRDGIPNIFQSEVYVKRRRARVKRYTQRLQESAAPLKEKAEPEGLVLVQLEMEGHAEAELLPLVDGEPVAFEDLESKVEDGLFPRPELERLQAVRLALDNDLRAFGESGQRLLREAEADLADLDRQMTGPLLNMVLSGVYQDYQDVAGVADYLRELENFLETRMAIFRAPDEDNGDDAEDVEGALRLLQVNLILDNGEQPRRPVIFENNPNAANLRGVVDREVRSNGQVVSDFTHIKAGSMIRAHGGFLVLHADDFDGGGRAWGVIKRTLRTGQVQIEAEEGVHGAVPRAPRPEPVPVDVKVILIGSVDLYHELLVADSDFPKVFKVKAEFDTEMELGPQAITEYACMVRRICDQEGLRPFSAEGVAAVVEHGVRQAGHRSRITTRFSRIADLVREAAFWAGRRHTGAITAEDVHRAVDERRNRVNLIEEKTQRLIREGILLIATEGAAVGQINGLAVIDVGDHRFGRPSRITASVAAGNGGVLNIERMSNLSGSSHDKGLLILTGYLMERFASKRPLALTAGITLEQSYDEVDGDSATVAEIYALISALAEAPVRQDLAVTGSLNQKGRVQAVGGVNEKIEGFFDICQARGLTGTQGVLIPAPNLPHLMLRPRVVNAVREGKFHIYALTRVEDGIELLTGRPAGEPDAEGRYPEDTILGRVQRRLEDLATASRDFFSWTERREGF